MRNGRDVGRITFGLVLAFSLIGLIWTLIPGARQQVTLVPPPVSFNNHTLNLKEIHLDLPKTLRSGEMEYIRLQVQPAESEASAPVLAEARLELLAAEIIPGEKIQTALSTVGPSRFEWEIRLVEADFQNWRGEPNGAGLSTDLPGTTIGWFEDADREVGRLAWPGNWAGGMGLDIPSEKVRFIPNIQCNFYIVNR
jgi:hypothetical protein